MSQFFSNIRAHSHIAEITLKLILILNIDVLDWFAQSSDFSLILNIRNMIGRMIGILINPLMIIQQLLTAV